MSAINSKLSVVQTKVTALVKQHQALNTEVAKQRSELKKLKEENSALQTEAEELRQQNLILKASLDTLSDADKKELERRLNNYIRDIERCINLLSR